MSINPKTYEGVAMGLADAGAQVTDDVAGALTELHKALIKDPNNLSRAASLYKKRVAQASREWEKNWRTWADEDLVNSYLQGFQHTELELERLRRAGMQVPPPAQPIPEDSPLAGKIPSGTKDIPAGVRKAFQGIPNHLTAYNVFRRAAYHHLEGTALQIVRASNDLYRDAAVQAMEKNFKETDIFTRRKLSQDMLDDFAQKGLQSVTYSNGRKVSIEAYSEMLGRTMSGHAAVQGSLNRYAEHGYDLVRVSAHFRACELCVPWEGRVLSQSGQEPGYSSLDEAISAGLFHPNCAHDISAYIPGLSPEELDVRVSPAEQKLIDQHGYEKAQEIAYKAQAQQRYMERQIRSWKRREMTALDSASKAKAHRKVLDWQKAQRNHLAKNSFLPRKYEREAVKGWSSRFRAFSQSPESVVGKMGTGTSSFEVSPLHREKTIEEAEQYIREKYKIPANFKGADVNAVRVTLDEIDDLASRFPEVVRTEFKGAQVAKLDKDTFAQYDYRSGMLTWNKSYLSNADALASKMKELAETGWNVDVGKKDATSLVRQLTRHEFGHAVDARYMRVSGEDRMGALGDAVINQIGFSNRKVGMSAYSFQNSAEFTAEAFVQYASGVKTPASEALGEIYTAMEKARGKWY
jgi:hypothetical protein